MVSMVAQMVLTAQTVRMALKGRKAKPEQLGPKAKPVFRGYRDKLGP
jgi:hypothetical protein